MMDLPVLMQNEDSGALRIRALKEKIDDETYLYDAIQRIALVLSNEISCVSKGDKTGERERKRR